MFRKMLAGCKKTLRTMVIKISKPHFLKEFNKVKTFDWLGNLLNLLNMKKKRVNDM